MYLSAIGFGMVFAGINIRYIQNHKDDYSDYDYRYDYDYNNNYLDEVEEVYNLQFAGGFLSTLFLVSLFYRCLIYKYNCCLYL